MTNRTVLAAAAAAVLVAGTGGAAIGANMALLGSEQPSEVGRLEVTSTSAELDLAGVAVASAAASGTPSDATLTPAVPVPAADPTPAPTDAVPAVPSTSSAPTAPAPVLGAVPDDGRVTADEAIAIAQAVVPGTVLEVELDVERGRTVYEVTLRAADGRRVEIYVDAADGAVLEIEEERDDEDDRDDRDDIDERDDDERVWDGLTGAITPDAAVAAAMAAVGGGDLVEVERDEHRGRAAYEVYLRVDGDLTEVYVDALSGAVLEVDSDD